MLSKELLARLVDAQAASDHPGAGRARTLGLLTVFNSLWEAYLLAPSGAVLVDQDDGAPRPGTRAEREIAYVQAARRFPELRHLMPERPPDARTCAPCGGSGVIDLGDSRKVFCGAPCYSRGWTNDL